MSSANQVMWRGAKIGAAVGGSLGFTAGMSICIIFKLPIPPLFITEMGLLLGGCVGALLAWAWSSAVGRRTLLGLLAGGSLGLPINLVFCLARGSLDPLPWLACLLLGGFLGYQKGQAPPTAPADPWKLHR